MADEDKATKNPDYSWLEEPEYDYGAEAADPWLQYDDYGNQGVDPGSQGDENQALVGLQTDLRMAQQDLADALKAKATADAKGFTAAAMPEQNATKDAVTAAQDRVKRLESALVTAQRMFATRQDSSGYQVLSKGNGLMTVYNKAKGRVENILDPTYQPKAQTPQDTYNAELAKARLAELQTYGLEGRPKSGDSTALANLAERQRENEFDWGQKFSFEKEKWQAGQDNWKLDFAEKQKQRDLDEGWRTAQRADAAQRDAVNLFGTTAQSFAQNLPYAAIPGQSHFLGFEPGGVWEGVAKSRGVAFDPERFRAPVQQYDPDEWWRQAQAMRGGGG